jgi:hypothetical protein
MSAEDRSFTKNDLVTKALASRVECTLLTKGVELTQEVINGCIAFAQGCLGCENALPMQQGISLSVRRNRGSRGRSRPEPPFSKIP